MGGTPFFVTAASSKQQQSGIKRRAQDEAMGVAYLRSQLEQLESTKKNQFVPLVTIRDLLMDHVLETMATDLKCAVVLVCEDVPDLRIGEEVNGADTANRDKNSAMAILSQQTLFPFLEGVTDGYNLYSKLGEGDSIPRCDSLLLRTAVSKREIEAEKKAAKKAIKKQIKKFKKSHGDSSTLSADFYVLNEDNLKRHLATVPFDAYKEAGYLITTPLPEDETRSAAQLLLAIDCEMCKTTKGVELTRLTIVDSTEKVVLDEYVRPKNPIVDYCTEYSGITCEIMEGCTTTLADVQKRFLELVPSDAILVGHSIENDLNALQIIHKRVIDTTVLYPHPRGPPFRSALRFLTSTYLRRAIQTGKDGHCSVEDAVATLQLVQLKVKKGPMFPAIEQEYTQKKVINELSLAKKSVLIVDALRSCRSLGAGTACTIPCDTNEKIVAAVVHQLTTGFPPHFTWARVRGASREEVTRHIAQVRAHLPAKSCMLVVASGDTAALRELHKVRTTRSDPRSSLMWDKEQQLRLDVLASRTQEGFVHVFVKE